MDDFGNLNTSGQDNPEEGMNSSPLPVENQSESSSSTSEPMITPPPAMPTTPPTQEPLVRKPDPAPQMSDPMTSEPKENVKSAGAIVGSIIIIVIIIIGGLYFWGKQLSKNAEIPVGPSAEEIAVQPDEILENLETQSTSDEISDIQADLDMTDLDNLDSELGDINLNF